MSCSFQISENRLEAEMGQIGVEEPRILSLTSRTWANIFQVVNELKSETLKFGLEVFWAQVRFSQVSD